MRIVFPCAPKSGQGQLELGLGAYQIRGERRGARKEGIAFPHFLFTMRGCHGGIRGREGNVEKSGSNFLGLTVLFTDMF